jgi:type VI secretion system protein ImpA
MNHVLDIDDLLQEVSPEAPCGEDLEYDPDFVAMEREARGKEEQRMGDSIVPAEEGDWRTVKNTALALFRRTKDLRVAVYLARALTKIDGLVGLHDGLALVRELLDRYWDRFHPNLDPEDDNDPTIRVNTLLNLCGGNAMLQPIRMIELASVKGIGRYTYQDYLVAAGKLPAPADPDTPLANLDEIEAAFTGCDLEELEEKLEATAGAVALVEAIETSLMNHVGPSHAVGMEPLSDLLKELAELLSAQVTRRGGVALEGEPGEVAGAPAASGELRGRDDVIKALDRICDYYQRQEPSSPVPLLLKRARGLVSKDFFDIVRDLAPSGIGEVENIVGKESE